MNDLESNLEKVVLSQEHENIAKAMLETNGDISKASRSNLVNMNAMQLRNEVAKYPQIRVRYFELLAGSAQELGLHIMERIVEMRKLQMQALGHTIVDEDGEEFDVPPDPKVFIECSKELSRLIAEGRLQNMSANEVEKMAAKLDGREILESLLGN